MVKVKARQFVTAKFPRVLRFFQSAKLFILGMRVAFLDGRKLYLTERNFICFVVKLTHSDNLDFQERQPAFPFLFIQFCLDSETDWRVFISAFSPMEG